MLMYRVLIVFISIFSVAGCMGTPRITDPVKTATEQLLISTAADRAFEELDLEKLAEKKIFIDASAFEGVEKGYVVGLMTIVLGKHGVLIVGEEKDAEAVVTITPGVLSIDRSDAFLGLPSFPMPFAGGASTPELAFFKTIKQTSIAKIAVQAYAVPTGEQILSIGPFVGTAYYNYRKLFIFFSFRTTDIMEKKKGSWLQP